MNHAEPAPPPPAELRCRLLDELGSGATGRVWRVLLEAPLGDLAEGVELALKRLHPGAAAIPAQLSAFERETEVASSIKSPGVVRGVASGEDEHGPWLALQLVPGPTLRERLEQSGALPEPQVRAIATRLVGALVALHDAGWLHGDLKPENVRLDAEGRAVLLDLGFVMPRTKRIQTRVTGSLAYLSPEELRGGAANETSEVYALGVVLYELATGTHPFASRERLAESEGLASVLSGASFEAPSLRVPTLSPFLDALLEELLARDPARRPSLAVLEGICRDQESGAWWRAHLDRGGKGSVSTATRGAELPLVGRDAELARLLDAARRTQRGQGGALRLEGPAGSGKSRLMSELARRVRRSASPPIYLRGRSPRFEEARPCQPLLSMLAHYLRLPAGEPPGTRERAKLEERLPTWERDALLEALDPAHLGTTSTAVPVALCAWLFALAEEGPVIVYLDDLDHADEGTLEVLGRLARRLDELPLLLVLGIDSETSPRRPEAQRRLDERLETLDFNARVSLPPLDAEAVRAITAILFSRKAPQLRLASVLWERSRGNPGLIAELVRGLVERGEAIPTDDGLDLRIHPDDLPLPASLRHEIGRAYARLNGEDREWLARLAVCGGLIQTRFLLSAWPRASASELDQTLARLTHGGWLSPQGDRYRFRRPALRAAIYRRVPAPERRALHADVARALRPGPGGRLSLGDAFQRAYHLRSAERFGELLQLLRPLLARVAERGQPARVHTLGRWGIEALDEVDHVDDPTGLALEFLWAAADASDRLGHRKEQREWLDRLSELEIDTEEQPGRAGRVYLLFARYSISLGQYATATGMLGNALHFFEQAGDLAFVSDTLRRLGSVQAHLGEFADARRNTKRALDNAPDDFLRARAEHGHGVLDLLEGDLEGALRRSDRVLMLLRGSELFEVLSVRALAHSLRARVYRGAGRPRRGFVSAQKALSFARRSGDRRLESDLQARLGVHLLDIDRSVEAEGELRDALLTATEIEDRRGESIASCFLGILLAEQDDPNGGTFLARSARIARDVGNARIEAVCTAIQARILFHRDPAAAVTRSARAVALLERAGAELIDRIVIRGTHAMVLEHLGRRSEARVQLDELRRRMRAATARIESPLLQRRQRGATRQLLRAALSPEGPVYRRVRLEGPLTA